MPAKSVAQQRLMAIALHHPSKLRDKSVLKMGKEKLKDFAETKHAGLKKTSDKLHKARKKKKSKPKPGGMDFNIIEQIKKKKKEKQRKLKEIFA